jgi:hypothetical protein
VLMKKGVEVKVEIFTCCGHGELHQEGPVSVEQQQLLVGSFSGGRYDALGQLIADITPTTSESVRINQVGYSF